MSKVLESSRYRPWDADLGSLARESMTLPHHMAIRQMVTMGMTAAGMAASVSRAVNLHQGLL